MNLALQSLAVLGALVYTWELTTMMTKALWKRPEEPDPKLK
jgi:hypothetical protein